MLGAYVWIACGIFAGYAELAAGQGPNNPRCQRQMDLCFIMDRSGSVGREAWELAKDFTIRLCESLLISRDTARVGVVTFSDNAELNVPLGQFNDINELGRAIRAIPPTVNGRTGTTDALDRTAMRCFNSQNDRDDATNIAILLSDGMANLKQDQLANAIRDIHRELDTLITVGIGDRIQESELIMIAKRSDNMRPPIKGQDYFTTLNFQELAGLLPTLAPQICGPTGTPPPQCKRKLDLAFILDRSGSVGVSGWNKILDFVKNILMYITVGEDVARVAIVTFADNARVDIGLGANINYGGLVDAINRIVYTRGETNTAEALTLTASEVFNLAMDRPDADNYVIILTDGNPTINTGELNNAIRDLHGKVQGMTSIGVGNDVLRDTLVRLAKSSNGRNNAQEGQDYFLTPTFDDLQGVADRLAPGVCPTDPPIINPPIRICSQALDICIVADRSGSVTQAGWVQTLSFIKQLVGELTIAPNFVRVGVVTFADTATVDIRLGQYSDMQSLQFAIENILMFTTGETNTADALAMTANGCFGTSEDRPSVENVVVFLTDGVATINMAGIRPAIAQLHAIVSVVSAIGVGPEIKNVAILRSISKRADNAVPTTGVDFFTTPDFASLPSLIELIAPQVCPTPPPCNRALDLCLVLDSSYSVRQQGWDMTRSFITTIVQSLNIGSNDVRIGVVTFSTEARLNIQLGEHNNGNDLMQAINRLPYIAGDTATAAALRLTANGCFNSAGDRSGALNLVLIVTDGIPTRGRDQLDSSIQQLHATASIAIAIGVGTELDQNILARISKNELNAQPRINQDYFTTPSFDLLQELFTRVSSGVCPTTPPLTTLPPECDRNLDVALVLDSSGSVRTDGWEKVKQFAAKFARCFSISTTNTRFSVVTFSHTARLQISPMRYANIDDLVRAIDNLQYDGGWTNTAMALNVTAAQGFSQEPDRRLIDDIVIFISDGSPTINVDKLPAAIENLHRTAELVASIGVGTEISDEVLMRISKTRDGRVPENGRDFFISPDFDTLTDFVTRVLEVTCVKPLTPPTPPIQICRLEADICYMLDRSGSETENGWRRVQQTALELIKANQAFAKATGVVTFSDHAVVSVPLGTYQLNVLQTEINRIPFANGYTNIGATLNLTATNCFTTRADNPSRKNVAIFVSDAVNTVNHHTVVPATQRLHRVSNFAVSIGIGVNISRMSLYNISEREDGRNPVENQDYWVDPPLTQVGAISDVIRNNLCESPVFPTTPPTTTPGLCTQEVDICVVLDSSSSVGMMGWMFSLQFTQNLIDRLDMSPVMVRLGVVSFATSAFLQFPPGAHNNKHEIMSSISMLPWLQGFTNTADALRITANQCITSRTDPSGRTIPAVVIVITDGESTVKQQETLASAAHLHSRAYSVISVGVGDLVNVDTLRDISKPSRDSGRVNSQENIDYFRTQDFRTLQSLTSQIASQACPNDFRP